MPGSSRRSAAGAGRGRRADAARPNKRARKTPRNGARRVGWSRRLGVAAALLLVAGAGIAFASGALDGDGSERSPAPSLPLLPVPALSAPNMTLTRASSVDIAGTLPVDSAAAANGISLEVRLYVNGELAARQDARGDDEFTFRDVPLEQGDNEIAAAVVAADAATGSDGREGPRSPVIVVTRDDVAPEISITRPATDRPVYRASETLLGRTEPGADLVVEIASTGRTVEASVASDGTFEASIALEMGANRFLLRSTDPAGNAAEEHTVITRAASLASIDLNLSRHDLTTDDLPAIVRIRARIRDELGALADGADVTFSVSPPNSSTMTHRVTSERGVATWAEMAVTGQQRAVGTWLVTVRAVLASGEEVRGDASIAVTVPEPAPT